MKIYFKRFGGTKIIGNGRFRAKYFSKISFSKACEMLVTFKAIYVSEYQFSALKKNLNPRSLKTIQNNNTKIQILLEYYSPDNFERFNCALKFSCKVGT